MTSFSSLQVLVVDDSAVVRRVISAVLGNEPGVAVTAAADPLIAMEKMRKKRPDVILLDLEMPRMDGLTFLQKVMSEDPIPVVICSSVAARGTSMALRALEAGAVSIVPKPKLGVQEFLHESAVVLVDAVRGAAQARVHVKTSTLVKASPKLTADAVLPARRPFANIATDKIVAVGASTGGTEALRVLLDGLPRDCPGIVIVQHMPAGFTAAFARRLNEVCPMEVKEAATGDRIVQGRALIAPGDHHLLIERNGSHYVAKVTEGPLVSRHRPSVDVLFRSVAQSAGRNAIGVIMTGMGDDGANGLLEMKKAGAATIAQDEATCVVFGMPKEAIARGAVDEVVSLPRLSSSILRRASSAAEGTRARSL